jgi:hypothetical protein
MTGTKGADKYLAFPVPYFRNWRTAKEFFLNGLKKLEKRNHKCVELKGEYVH